MSSADPEEVQLWPRALLPSPRLECGKLGRELPVKCRVVSVSLRARFIDSLAFVFSAKFVTSSGLKRNRCVSGQMQGIPTGSAEWSVTVDLLPQPRWPEHSRPDRDYPLPQLRISRHHHDRGTRTRGLDGCGHDRIIS